MLKPSPKIIILPVILIWLSGCVAQTTDSTNVNTGKLLGTLIGGVGGYALCKSKKKDNCEKYAAIGAVAGFTIGALIDERRKRLKRVAAKYRVQKVSEYTVYDENDEVIGSIDEVSNDVFYDNSSEMKPDGDEYLKELARVYKDIPTKIKVSPEGPGSTERQIARERKEKIESFFDQQSNTENIKLDVDEYDGDENQKLKIEVIPETY